MERVAPAAIQFHGGEPTMDILQRTGLVILIISSNALNSTPDADTLILAFFSLLAFGGAVLFLVRGKNQEIVDHDERQDDGEELVDRWTLLLEHIHNRQRHWHCEEEGGVEADKIVEEIDEDVEFLSGDAGQVEHGPCRDDV